MRELAQSVFDGHKHRIFTLNDFTSTQAREFLGQFEGLQSALPAWLPGRPLLIGYLATQGFDFRDRRQRQRGKP